MKQRIPAYLISIFRREPWWAEFWSASFAIGWAAVFFCTKADTFGQSALWFLSRAHGGAGWACYSLFAGLAQMTFLLWNRRLLRWCAAIVMGWFPWMIALSLALEPQITPSIAVYGGWAGINTFSVLRLLRREPP
jgi:hypothetical protein